MHDDFAKFISRYLPGKIQKISVNAGFSCPNRDGTKGTGGCIYCNNSSFSPGYTLSSPDIKLQIEQGKAFFARKYPTMRYLAYFQSYTATNAPLDTFMDMIAQALSCPDVDGIIIGTRPDSITEELLIELSRIARHHFVMVEYGAETSHDSTLQLINRCHTWADTVHAVNLTAKYHIPVGLHFILGLPGETKDDMMATIDAINTLPVDIVKFHQLQVIRGTRLATEIAAGRMKVNHPTVDEYIDLCCDIDRRLRPDIAIERFLSQSPPDLLISPRWGLKNYQFINLLRNRL